jgi:predicted pyridoxine 5'-phosphate oxidase superfamily flavin-nucleotide-binding protein
MITEEIKQMIEENPVAVSTITNNNKPYTIAVAFVKIKDDKIIITNNHMKKTIENLKQNSNISLAVWNSKWEGYQINGLAEYFEQGEWLEFVKSLEENKEEPCKGAIVINVNDIKELG